jgi:hypothetical protein
MLFRIRGSNCYEGAEKSLSEANRSGESRFDAGGSYGTTEVVPFPKSDDGVFELSL